MDDQQPQDIPAPATPADLVGSVRPTPPPPPRKKKGKGKKAKQREHMDRRQTAKAGASSVPLFLDIPYQGTDPITGEPTTTSYTIARADALNVETFELIEDGKYVTAVRAWLRPVQWQTFKDQHRATDGTVPMDALEGFLNAVLKRVPSLGN